ncbi:MAG: winged helix-turn-helix domain-containing protein [Rhodanobacteraceae bacterium]
MNADKASDMPRAYEFGEFRLDLASRELARRDGTRIALTSKAFDALLYLLEHHGTVLAKNHLISAIWPGRVIEENNLNQCIGALRRALGVDAGDRRYIVTVPGHGYRFAAAVHPIRELDRVEPQRTDGSQRARHTDIAVLPFKPLLAGQRDEALEFGMAETLIAKLSGTRRLVLRSLSAVRRFAQLDTDPLAAGRDLGVGAVIEGQIQRDDDRVRVTCRLLSVADGTALWSGSFDARFSDVFTLQDAIAERVAGALALELSRDEQRAMSAHGTSNSDAYRLYLTGRYAMEMPSPVKLRTAIDAFRHAIDIDPVYALAYAGLAEGYRRLPLAGDAEPMEVFPLARAAAEKALAIDDQLALAYATLGWVSFLYDWDWDAAAQNFERAIALDSNVAEACLGYAHMLANLGRHEKARELGKRACQIEPLSPIVATISAGFAGAAGDVKAARVALDRVLAMAPGFWIALLHRAELAILSGNYAQAIPDLVLARERSGGNFQVLGPLGFVLARCGREEEARAILDEIQERGTRGYVPPNAAAMIYAGFGDHEQALLWLERAVDVRAVRVCFMRRDPEWNALRNDPRFRKLAHRANLE